MQLYQHELLPIIEATSELCGSPWTPAKQNCTASTEHRGNWREKKMKHLSGKCFLKESVAVGSRSRGWNARDGSRGMDQPSECMRGRQGFLIKSSLSHSNSHLLFIPHEITKNMAHILLLLETQSQPNDHVTNWPFSCTLFFVFLNFYFQTCHLDWEIKIY